MSILSTRIVIACLALALMPGAAQAATDHRRAEPERPQPERAAEILVAATKTYNFVNIFPFPVDIRIEGNGPSFPKVVRLPAAPSPPVPVPYPNTSMKMQVKKPNGTWSNKFTVMWKAGSIALPSF